MASPVAGVDWAHTGWLAVYFENGCYDGYAFEPTFNDLWDNRKTPSLVLVDVPIGLPEDKESLAVREKLDSLARSVTKRPSSVFPVPSREACKLAFQDEASYDTVVEQNEKDLDKGLSWQSYYIAKGIGEIDDFLRENESAKEWIIEAHPEVCFRGILGHPLEYGKNSAAGTGERLLALQSLIDNPEKTLERVTVDLHGESSDIEIDDVIDAIGLALTASRGKEELEYIPEKYGFDPNEIPIRMAYWGEESLTG